MKVSVIVLTYNQEKSIARTLDSVLSQQISFEMEILVGDDYSTDKTAEICREYALRYPQIRHIRHPQNIGVVENYFEVLQKAKGEYIADCAGDDYWILPNKLQRQVDILDNHPNVALVHTNWSEVIVETGQVVRSARRVELGSEAIVSGRTLLSGIVFQLDKVVIHLCTSMYRRKLFFLFYDHHIELFRSKDLPCEDVQVAFAMAWLGDVYFWNEDTLAYNVELGTISHSSSYRKRYQFSRQLTLLTQRILSRFPVGLENSVPYYQLRFWEQLMHLFRLNAKEEVEEVVALMKEVGYTPSVGIKVLLLILRVPVLYVPVKAIRDAVVFLKGRTIE